MVQNARQGDGDDRWDEAFDKYRSGLLDLVFGLSGPWCSRCPNASASGSYCLSVRFPPPPGLDPSAQVRELHQAGGGLGVSVGALAFNRPRQLMGYRQLMAERISWDDAIAHAAKTG